MKRMFALFVASIVASACGNGGPLAPTAPASSAAVASTVSAGAFTVSGVVTDANGGLPLRDARVVVSSENERRLAFSDSGGYYSIQGLPSGLWSVTVSKPGYHPESVEADVNTDVALAFELSRGHPEFP